MFLFIVLILCPFSQAKNFSDKQIREKFAHENSEKTPYF